ncbi:MAG: hypothetical protein KGM43_11470 [Planctomycetota bacterium]|nr:hypothetical protein [Planctomycetota bacterium]
MADVRLRVQPVDPRHGIADQTLGGNQPLTELVNRLEVMVVRPCAQVIFVPDVLERFFDLLCIKVGQHRSPGRLNQTANARHRELAMLRRRIVERTVERCQMLLDRALPDGQRPLLGRIDHAPPAEHDLVFELGRKLLR